MASEAGRFDFADCARAIADKLVDRHPHVFGSESRDKSAAQQVRDWETIKATERAARAERARAEADLVSGDADEGLTWRVAQIEPTLDAANRPEMHESEPDAARNSALLKELLVNPPRRGR